MSMIKSTNFGGPVGTTRTGQNGASPEVLDKMMPPADGRVATNKRPLPAAKRQAAQRNQQAQRGNNPVKTGHPRTPAGTTVPTLQTPQRSPSPRPQTAANQAPARNPYTVNVTNTSTSAPNSSNNATRVTAAQSTRLNSESELKTAVFVQGNTGRKVSPGGSTATSSSVLGGSVELERTTPTSRKDTTVTARAKGAVELNNSSSGTAIKGELGVSVTGKRQFDKTTSASITAGGKVAISSTAPPTVTVSARADLDKVISADGKLKLNLNAGVDQALGGRAESYFGGKVVYAVDKTTSLNLGYRESNNDRQISGGIEIKI
jgi:hypothetical protein